MTDSTPPSIPPRKRPTSPASTGRQTTSTPVRAGSNAAWNGPADASATTSAATDIPTASSSNGTSSIAVPATVLPPTVAPPPRTSVTGGRTASSGSAGAADPSRTSVGGAKTAIRLGDGVTVPPEKEPDRATSPAPDDEDDGPSPMMVAVDATSAWLKKAGTATTAAFASLTRPRTEEPTMTTTPATAPSASPRAPLPNPGTENIAGPRPSSGRIPTVGQHGAPRRVRLAISRIDPWSVMKLSLLLSVAIGIMFVVAVTVLWATLNGMHVFAKIDDLVTQIVGKESPIDITQFVEYRRVVSGATLIAVVDVFLLTALSTIGAFLYNIVAALVGGVHVTMTDE